jgi:two-component system phosphate regulon sensor histidine kinase PhoR
MVSNAWKTELARLAALALAALAGALLTDYWACAFIVGLLGLIGWHIRQMYRVERWLVSGAAIAQAPETSGIWAEIVHHIYRLQQRNRRRKKRLTSILNRFHRSTEAMPDAAVVLGRNREIEWANHAAYTLLNIRNPQDHGQRIDNLLRDPAFHDYLAVGDFAEPLDMPAPVDENIELNLRIIPYGDGKHLLMARDASSLRRAEAARRDFVANVSHELRTPLTVITGYVESFDGDELPDYVRAGIDAIERQSRRMLAIVQDLLTLSKLETEPVDRSSAAVVRVPELLAGLRHDAASLASDRGHTIELQAEPTLGLQAVEAELTSAFANLVNNAVKHTPDGAHVTIQWLAVAGGALLRVHDNGPGIDPQHLARLTERFYRVDTGRSRARGGTGLGLSVAKHALYRNGATLEIDSQPGAGTTFTARFPAERIVRLEPSQELADGAV